MTPDIFLFWFLAATVILSGLAVVMFKNPIFSSLSLVMTMVGIAALFVTLNAYFIAGVQLIVYAGAVMVLFVMVLMLFDLKGELQAFTRGRLTGSIKIAIVGALSGLIVGAMTIGKNWFEPVNKEITAASASGAANQIIKVDPTQELATVLFTKHIFIFEVLGVLLLVIAIGAVSLARSKGGTHAKH